MLNRKGPLAGRYPAAAIMVMLALIPYLALSAALDPLTPIIAHQLHMSSQTMSLSTGLGNAAYAVGTVLAVQFAQHLPQRRMLFVYAVLLVIGSVLAAAAQDPGMYIAGHTIQGLCTSLLLIAAVPPLALGYPPDKFRDTAVIMSICIFGAVALGPLIGGAQAQAHAWRPLFWVVAGIAVAALVLVVLTFEDAPPADRTAPKDPFAILLAAVGCVAAFVGVSELTTHRFGDAIVVAPLVGGVALILVLVTYQHRSSRPLLTIRDLLTSSIPVAGLIIALFAAAASVSASTLIATVLTARYSPIHIGLLFVPELGGAVITALALGWAIRRRELPFLPLVGMAALAAGIAVFLVQVPPSQTLTLIGSGLTGVGLGATVAPALFIAGLSLRSRSLQRVFAMVELMRAVAAFLIAPIFAYLAATAAANLAGGTRLALWISLGLVAVGTVAGVAVYILSGARLETPDLHRYIDGDEPAWSSPPLLARLRPPAAAPGAGAPTAGGPVERPDAEVEERPLVLATAGAPARAEERNGVMSPPGRVPTGPGGAGAAGALPLAPTNGNGHASLRTTAPGDGDSHAVQPPSVESVPQGATVAPSTVAPPPAPEDSTSELSVSLTFRWSRSPKR